MSTTDEYRDRYAEGDDDVPDEGGSGTEGEDEKPDELDVEELTKETLKRIKCNDLDLTQPDQLLKFKEGDGEKLASTTDEQKQSTALHIIASLKGKKELPEFDDKMEPLIKFLVGHKKNLLSVQDRWGLTALHVAIEQKQEAMVRWMCEEHKDIGTIIAICNEKTENCIHIGIKHKFKGLDCLIEKAGAEALVAKDHAGNTPLHLAVDYKYLRKPQMDIVEKIVTKGDPEILRLTSEPSDSEPSKSQCSDFNHAGLSPFLHHLESVRAAKKKDDKKEAEDQGKKRTTDAAASENSSSHNTASTLGVAAPGQRHSMMSHSNPLTTEKGKSERSQIEAAMDSKAAGKYGAPRPKAPSAATPSAQLAQEAAAGGKKLSNKTAESGTASDPKATSTARKKALWKPNQTMLKDMERFLKLHYLRSRSYNAALKSLYGQEVASDLELYFDLSGKSDIKQTDLEDLFANLKFEEILQYTAIPNLKVEMDIQVANSKKPRASGKAKHDGSGRQDLCYIFKRLRDKEVKTILKVIVDDMESPAHSDQAIEEALVGFDVEVWDWMRADLCSEVIRRAAPQVREVHLYWSGNNAVLRGWAEEGGLQTLKKLRKVHLYIQKGLETGERTQKNVDDFVKLMKTRCPEASIFEVWPVRANADLASQRTEEQAEITTKHEWIQCMKDFVKLLYDAEMNYEGNNQGRKVHERIEEPIKIALIDDGVDIKGLEFPSIGGRSFFTRDEDHNLNGPYYVSSTGHGTMMAKKIHQLCPRAQFYVLRLDDRAAEDGVRQLTTKSAAEAIQAAITKKVHIISMSWTIDPPSDEKERQTLEKAIIDAANAGILMFCSASDKGAKTGQTFPAMAKPDRICTIGAATASGAADTWIGDANINFTFPGVKVGVDGDLSEPGPRELTGSSVATALAAGLAGLVLYCAQVRILLADDKEKPEAREDFEHLKKHESMMQALTSIGTTAESKGKYIKVWDLFGKEVEKRDPTNPEAWIKLIAEVGKRMCDKAK